MTPIPPLRVLELGHAIRTAYCGHVLARWGVEVVKAPGSDREGADPAELAHLDRGKELHDGTGADLLDDVQVVIAPGSERLEAALGMPPAALAAARPDLVIGIATPFGERGEYARLRGGELQELALGGLLAMVGERGREPLRLGGSQAELAAALALFTAVEVALLHRAETGRGAIVSTSGVRSVAYLDWKSEIHWAAEDKVLTRGSTNGPLVLACSDGHVGFYYRDEEWEAVKRLVGDPALDDERFATQLGRDRHRADLEAALAAFARTLTRNELYHRAQAAKIPAGSVLTLAELAGDPQLTARGAFGTVAVDGIDDVTVPRAPWTVDGIREATA